MGGLNLNSKTSGGQCEMKQGWVGGTEPPLNLVFAPQQLCHSLFSHESNYLKSPLCRRRKTTVERCQGWWWKNQPPPTSPIRALKTLVTSHQDFRTGLILCTCPTWPGCIAALPCLFHRSSLALLLVTLPVPLSKMIRDQPHAKPVFSRSPASHLPPQKFHYQGASKGLTRQQRASVVCLITPLSKLQPRGRHTAACFLHD